MANKLCPEKTAAPGNTHGFSFGESIHRKKINVARKFIFLFPSYSLNEHIPGKSNAYETEEKHRIE